MTRLRRPCEWLSRRRTFWPAITVGLVLALPALWVGLQGDDWTIRATVLELHTVRHVAGTPLNPFSFLDGDPERTRRLMDAGWLPWWSAPEARASFFRPVTGLTHIADYRLLDRWPALMHVHSLAWFAVLLWAVAVLYRRLMGQSLGLWVAALATLLFAVDEAHAMPVGWLANRNTLIAGVFGVLALIAHDRWRRDGWRAGALLAPVALAAALLAKEAAACVGAYLLAYALFLDRGPWRKRLLSLLPCLAVGVVWIVAWKAMGHGLEHMGIYADPGREPLRYLRQTALNGPLLLCGQWALPGSDTSLMLSSTALRIHWLWAVGVTALVALALAPLIARDRLARFWALGMLLSLLPACAAFIADRLLLFVGLGAMGLLAQWLAGRGEDAPWLPASPVWRWLARVAAVAFVLVHLVVAPLLLPVATGGMRMWGTLLDRQYAGLPDDEAFATQTAVFANSVTPLAEVLWIQQRLRRGQPIPVRSLRLCPSMAAATLNRVDDRTLVVRPEGGYLVPQGEWPGGDRGPAFSPLYVLRYLDRLFRGDARSFPLGYRVELTTATIEITALTDDGRPAEATFRFARPLEDPGYRWLTQTGSGCAPFTPPRVGQSVVVLSPAD